jgi:transposase InsO family protein
VLADFSRFSVAWRLCPTMKAQDVTATLDLALAASDLNQMTVVHRPRLLSDNGSSSRRISWSGWITRKWSTSAAFPITHRPR